MQTLLGVTCSALFEVFESTRCGGSVPCSCFGFKSYPYFCRPFPVFIFAFHSTFVFFLRIKADKYDVAAWESLIVETSKVCHLCESHLFSVSVFKYYSSIYILLQKTQGHPLTSHNSSRLFFYLPSRHKRTLAPVEHCARPRVLQTVLGSVSDGVCALEGVRYYEY